MNIKDVRKRIKTDKENLIPKKLKKRLFYFLTSHNNYKIYKSLKYFRYYYYYKRKNNYLMMIIYGRKKNNVMNKYNIELCEKIGKNIKIPHRMCIINENAEIGDNCSFHGFNIVGNDGKNEKAPKIGNNVDVGVGAMIIGNIYIADNCKIGANALVNKSCYQKGAVLIGIPAKVINNN